MKMNRRMVVWWLGTLSAVAVPWALLYVADVLNDPSPQILVVALAFSVAIYAVWTSKNPPPKSLTEGSK